MSRGSDEDECREDDVGLAPPKMLRVVVSGAKMVLAKPATNVSAVSARMRCSPYQWVNAANAGETDLGTVPFDIPEEQTAKLQFPTPVPAGTATVDFTLMVTQGVGPKGPHIPATTSLAMPPG